MLNDLTSIIFPVYNAENTIERAVESAMNQTYEKIEIIVIDDGSTDNTARICDHLASKDLRIKVFHTENKGEAAARNMGLFKAAGIYVAYCDADDYMHPDMIEKMYKAVVHNKAEIGICSWRYVDVEGRELPWRTTDIRTTRYDSKDAQRIFLETKNFEGFCWNKLVLKSLYGENDIQYDENRVSYCDILANFRLLGRAELCVFIEDKLYDYYQMPTSCIHTPSMKKHRDYLETIEQVYEEAKVRGLEKPGYKYLICRLNKYLFDIYKENRVLMSQELKKHYCEIYEKWLKISLYNKLMLAIKYPDENILKSVVKTVIVQWYYWKVISK